MKNLSSFINDTEKETYNKKIKIVLENNITLNTEISVSDINESYATTQIYDMIKDKKILSVHIMENMVKESVTIEKEEVKTGLYYIPFTSIFEKQKYQIDNIINLLKDDENISSIHTENQFGWEKEPIILVLKLDEANGVKDRILNKLKFYYDSKEIRLSKKDW